MTILSQNASAAVVVGPILNVSGSVMVDLAIANTAITLVKYASVSAARNATTSAASVGPGMYRIVLNATDTDTMGEMALLVSGSAALPFVKYIEIWNAATHALYYGSADSVPGSAAMSAAVSAILNSYNVASAGEVASAGISSAGISAIVHTALGNYDVPTSADVSVLVSVGVQAALVNYDVATSADVSAIFAAVGGVGSAAVSTIVAGVLTNYDVPTSADVSAIVNAISMTSGSVSSLIHNALVNYDVATSADVSAILTNIGGVSSAQVSVIVAGVLTNYDVPTSADVSAIVSAVVSGVLNSYNVASAGEVASAGINSAGVSAIVHTALVNRDVLTSGATHLLVTQALQDYTVPRSADISAVVGPAVWNRIAVEPAAAPAWTSVNRGQLLDWLGVRAVNRHHQASASVGIFTSANAQIASASVGITSTSANQDRWR